MTVKQAFNKLRKMIKEGYEDSILIKSSDDEGNSFQEVTSIDYCYSRGKGYNVEVFHPDDVDDYLDEEEEGNDDDIPSINVVLS